MKPSPPAKRFLARHLKHVRGALQVAVAGTVGVSTLAEAVHSAVLSTVALSPKAPPPKTAGLTGAIYASVRGAAKRIGKGGETALDALVKRLDDPVVEAPLPIEGADSLQAIVNGVFGDTLHSMDSPWALPMTLHEREMLTAKRGKRPAGRVLFVHGLCMHDGHWQGSDTGVDFAELLHGHVGLRPHYLRYNSGMAIEENGERLAQLLEAQHSGRARWRGEFHVVAHSMGGLVLRSALAQGRASGMRWPSQLGHVVFLGTPHSGAPLERLGAVVDQVLEWQRFSAPWSALGKLRSKGITDLRTGDLASNSAHETHIARFHAVAGTLLGDRGELASESLGDGLVPVSSALAHGVPHALLPIHSRKVFHGIGHLSLISHPAVATHVVRCISGERD
jgi:pimeloyl-ACP methyl ester carboxylesterase